MALLNFVPPMEKLFHNDIDCLNKQTNKPQKIFDLLLHVNIKLLSCH